jgi:hypothetical protein
MSRFIDADALIERKFILHDMEELTHEEFEKLVNEQPTAHDVEKVVAELEERKEKASGCFGVMCSDCKYTKECYEGEKSYKVAFDKAIDIVKKDGVE